MSDPTPAVERVTPDAPRHAAVAAAVAEVHSAPDPVSPTPAVRRSVSSAGTAPAVTADVAPKLAVASPTPVGPAEAVVLPAAAPVTAPPLPNPIVGLLTEVATVVNTLIAPNPAVPPMNPLHLLVFEFVRRIEMTLGLPVAGTPIVATPDPIIGTNPVSTSAGPVSYTHLTLPTTPYV